MLRALGFGGDRKTFRPAKVAAPLPPLPRNDSRFACRQDDVGNRKTLQAYIQKTTHLTLGSMPMSVGDDVKSRPLYPPPTTYGRGSSHMLRLAVARRAPAGWRARGRLDWLQRYLSAPSCGRII